MSESLAAHIELARELATLKSRVDTLDADTCSQFEGRPGIQLGGPASGVGGRSVVFASHP